MSFFGPLDSDVSIVLDSKKTLKRHLRVPFRSERDSVVLLVHMTDVNVISESLVDLGGRGHNLQYFIGPFQIVYLVPLMTFPKKLVEKSP